MRLRLTKYLVVAIAWSGLRYLRFYPDRMRLHQRPWWNVRRWRFSLTVTTGGYWQLWFGPLRWARDLYGPWPGRTDLVGGQ